MNELATRIAEKAKQLRALHELSLDEAAKRAGITKSHMWEFEQGRSINPTLRMLQGIADAYGVSLASLIGEEKFLEPQMHPFALKVAAMINEKMKENPTGNGASKGAE